MSNRDEIVLSYEDVLIRESDLKLLNPRQWLNDNLISFYFSYLTDHLVSKTEDKFLLLFPEMTQLIKSAKHSPSMIKELKLMFNDDYYAEKSVWFIPINDAKFDANAIGGSHWSLFVYYKKDLKCEHYDSLEYSNNSQEARDVCNILSSVLCDENVSLDYVEKKTIKQSNSYDCGIHLLCNCEALLRIIFLNDENKLEELASSSVIENKREQIKNLILDLKDK